MAGSAGATVTILGAVTSISGTAGVTGLAPAIGIRILVRIRSCGVLIWELLPSLGSWFIRFSITKGIKERAKFINPLCIVGGVPQPCSHIDVVTEFHCPLRV